MTESTKCETCVGHEGHLCVLMSNGKMDEVRDCVKDPKFICFNCGRVAHSKHNLCNPMPLEGIAEG